MKKALAIISVISILAILLLIVCRKGHLIPTEGSLLKKCKVDRANTNLDNQSIERVESLASCVMSWKEIGYDDMILADETNYAWCDVALSMLENPDSVKFSTNTCEICGKKSLVEIYFKSPSYTWEKLCGRAGEMILCTDCKRQVKFRVTMMN